MNRSFASLLVEPSTGNQLTLEVQQTTDSGDILEGTLRTSAGATYAIRNGIPRFVEHDNEDQAQTEGSFGYKWKRRGSYEAPAFHDSAREWVVARYGFSSAGEMRDYFASRGRVLDAGCGAGFSSSLWMDDQWKDAEWVGADISEAIDVAADRLGKFPGTSFAQADLLKLPFREGAFNVVFCEGVMHHTPSTEGALRSLHRVLAPAGEIMFYVYRKKGPVREFTDDYIRDRISDLDPDDAWEQMESLAKLGEALANLEAEVEIADDVPLLGIKAGRYDVQRLLYWHFAKLFWNRDFTLEQNTHVNFDWYHPKLAHRHSEEEVRGWCDKLGMRIIHFDGQESGFTVRALKG